MIYYTNYLDIEVILMLLVGEEEKLGEKLKCRMLSSSVAFSLNFQILNISSYFISPHGMYSRWMNVADAAFILTPKLPSSNL